METTNFGITAENVIQETNTLDINNQQKQDTQEEKKNIKNVLSKKNTIDDVYHIKEFINLLEMIVKSKNIETDINITISDKIREGFLRIIQTKPEFFIDFEKTISFILADNKIDIDDLPYLTDLISKLYRLINKMDNVKYTQDEKFEMCMTIIKFVIRVMVKENKINLGSNNEDIFLEKIDMLVDSCIDLIKINTSIEVQKCGCFW
jgi:hypothetical protein